MAAGDRERVLILGTGEMGRAMLHLLEPHCEVETWEGLPPDGSEPPPLQARVRRAGIVVLCVPVTAHEQLAPQVAGALADGAICATIAKGLDSNGRTAAEILAESLGGKNEYAVIYGPMLSEDLAADRFGFADIACARPETFERLARLLADTRLRVAHSDDILGATWAVILKNVYVPLIGAAEALDLGDNVRGFLASTAFIELADIVANLGGQPETPYRLAGLGDFVGSATGAGSHHRALGAKLARGEREGIDGEGVNTLAVIARQRPFDPSPYPLFQLAARMVENPPEAAGALIRFLSTWPHSADVPTGSMPR